MTTSLSPAPHSVRELRSEQTIRSYVTSVGGVYLGNWALHEILSADDLATPKGHLRCQCRTSDGRVHCYSIPELRPSKAFPGVALPSVIGYGEKEK